AGDPRALLFSLRRYLSLIVGVSVPVVATLVILSHFVVGALYERGAFSSDDTSLVSGVQTMLALQIPFYLGGILLVRVVASLRANRILLWGSALNVCVNVALNWLFMSFMGVRGIALSTSIVYFISFVFVLIFCTKAARRK